MSSIFEDLNDLIQNNSTGRVLGVILLIFVLCASVALGFAYWITRMH